MIDGTGSSREDESRQQTGSRINTHNATLNVKAMLQRHHLTANQHRRKQIIGAAVLQMPFLC